MWRAAALGLVSALLFSLAFPPFELAPIAWVALVPLLVVVVRPAASAREIAWAGGTFGFAVFAIHLRWFFAIFDLPALVLWAFLAWLTARTLWLAWRAGQRWGDRALVIALPTFWVGLEHFRSECWWLSFGWITPGYAQASDPRILPAADVLGVYGLSFVVVLTSALAAWSLTRPMAPRRARVMAVLALPIAYGVLAGYGARRTHEIEARMQGELPIRVALVQYETNRFEDAEQMLAEDVPAGTQLVVFPEVGAVTREGRRTWLDDRADALHALARAHDAVLVVGGEREAPGGNPIIDFYNTLAIVEPRADAIDYYTKAEPVPLFADGVPSTDVHAYDTSLGRLGFAICYDFTHPHVVDALVPSRAFVVASGDLASWTELQHAQHALVTHVRAVEHRRWVARATSSGYSQLVDPLGRVRAQLGFGERGVLVGTIGLSDETTLYDRVGLVPARIALLAWAVMIAMELGAWLRARRRGELSASASPGDARPSDRAS